MRSKLLLILLIGYVGAFAQLPTMVGFLSRGGQSVQYVYPDDAPTFSEPITLASNEVGVGGQLRNTDVAGASDIILSGTWSSAVWMRSLVGTDNKWVRIRNLDSSFTAGTAAQTTGHGVDIESTCNYIEIIGRDKDAPFKASAGGGLSGIVPRGTASEMFYKLTNISIKDVGYSGILSNSESASVTYKKALINFLKVDGLVGEGEGIYLGSTSANFARVDLGFITQAGIRNKGREGIQFNHVADLHLYNSTAVNVGVTVANPHNHLFQIFCSNGVVENCIFDGGPVMGNFFTHGVTIKNTYFRFTSAGAYFGRSDQLSYAGEAEFNDEPVVFENCIIHWDGAGVLPHVAWVEERQANIEFKNCIFVGNITTLYYDTRAAGYTNTLIGTLTTNGNTVISSLSAPSYVSANIDDKDFLHTNSQYFINLGMGKGLQGTGNLRMMHVRTPGAISVEEDTAFGSAPFPSTVSVLLQNGKEVPATVTWDENDYDSSEPASFTVSGTITPPAGTVNPASLTTSIAVTITPIPPDNIVLLSLKGTATTDYVTTGNWNHAPQSYASGSIQIKGDNSTQNLTSLRDVNGNLTGIGLSTIGTFEGLETIGKNTAGVYPAVANKTTWEMQGSIGTTRSFKLTGLNNSISYNFKVMSSVDPSYASNSQITLAVTGASGGGTVTAFASYDNVNTVMEFNNVVPNSGEINFAVTRPTSGRTNISVIEINWDNP
jgi:hypothetical protein